jgi:hypothetical protein
MSPFANYSVTVGAVGDDKRFVRTMHHFQGVSLALSSNGDLVVTDQRGVLQMYANGEWFKAERVDG